MKTKQYNWVNLLNKRSVFNSEEIPINRPLLLQSFKLNLCLSE